MKNDLNINSLLKPHRRRLTVIVLCLTVAALLALVQPWCLKIVIDDVFLHKNAQALILVIGLLVLALIGRAISNFIRMRMNAMTGEEIASSLRGHIYSHIQERSLSSIQNMPASQILSRMTQDVESVRSFIVRDAAEFIYAGLGLLLTAVILLKINPVLAGISFIAIPGIWGIYRRLMPSFQNNFTELKETQSRFFSRLNETLASLTTIRAFSCEKMEEERFLREQKGIATTSIRTQSLHALLWTLVEASSSLAVILVLWFGGQAVLAGTMSAGDVVAFYTYLIMLFMPLSRLTGIGASYQEARTALARINAFIRIHDNVTRSPDAETLPVLYGGLAFRNVSFSYATGKPVIQNVSFSVDPGTVLAIVGSSGAGKTTLTSLLLRLFDPAEGTISIDGHDLKDIDLENYRKKITCVLQDDTLFHATVRENILYGLPPGICQENIELAARAAHAHDFILDLPQGYDTLIGERGITLSGGQRQRLVIARALARHPSILILDEATSSVDALTENLIQDDVRRWMHGKTVIIVAHRFSSITWADRILVLEHGQIVEQGSHEALVKKNGLYSRLYKEQFVTT